mgnify:CR=1 FL=1
MTKTLFTEKQKFRQIWVIVIISATLALAIWGFMQQIILGKPFGNNPVSDWVLILLLLAPLLIFTFFFALTLHTRIDQHGISYRFAPVHRSDRLIRWDSVEKCHVRKYKPIAEYGGWGFRRGRSGVAYNTAGNMGLQLELKDGKKLLLGTRKPDELKRTLEKLGKTKPEN